LSRFADSALSLIVPCRIGLYITIIELFTGQAAVRELHFWRIGFAPMAHYAPPQRLTIADLLAKIQLLPSILDQLAYLSSLRDPNIGAYTHPAITEPALRRQADDELRRAHEAVFRRWLNLRLEEQKADLDLCVAGLPSDEETVLNTWRALETYRTFFPASACTAPDFLDSFLNYRHAAGSRASRA
jgi:hypothetical protein